MRAFRDQDHLARVAARLQRRADREQAANLAMRARLGAHRHAVHAGQLDQPVGRDRRSAASAPCTVSAGCSGWMSAKPGIRATFSLSRGLCFIVHEPEREQAEVDRIILPAEAGVMAHRLGLGEPGEADRRGALETRKVPRRRPGSRAGALLGPGLRRGTRRRNPPRSSRCRRSRTATAPRASAPDCR